MKWIPGTVLACLALAACGGPEPAPQAAAVKDCGTFVLSQGDRLPEPAARCLIEAAHAGDPARLAMTRPTIEGDPIPVTYTVGTDGSVEVLTDSRQDQYGADEVSRQICTEPSAGASAGPEIQFGECSGSTPVR